MLADTVQPVLQGAAAVHKELVDQVTAIQALLGRCDELKERCLAILGQDPTADPPAQAAVDVQAPVGGVARQELAVQVSAAETDAPAPQQAASEAEVEAPSSAAEQQEEPAQPRLSASPESSPPASTKPRLQPWQALKLRQQRASKSPTGSQDPRAEPAAHAAGVSSSMAPSSTEGSAEDEDTDGMPLAQRLRLFKQRLRQQKDLQQQQQQPDPQQVPSNTGSAPAAPGVGPEEHMPAATAQPHPGSTLRAVELLAQQDQPQAKQRQPKSAEQGKRGVREAVTRERHEGSQKQQRGQQQQGEQRPPPKRQKRQALATSSAFVLQQGHEEVPSTARNISPERQALLAGPDVVLMESSDDSVVLVGAASPRASQQLEQRQHHHHQQQPAGAAAGGSVGLLLDQAQAGTPIGINQAAAAAAGELVQAFGSAEQPVEVVLGNSSDDEDMQPLALRQQLLRQRRAGLRAHLQQQEQQQQLQLCGKRTREAEPEVVQLPARQRQQQQQLWEQGKEEEVEQGKKKVVEQGKGEEVEQGKEEDVEQRRRSPSPEVIFAGETPAPAQPASAAAAQAPAAAAGAGSSGSRQGRLSGERELSTGVATTGMETGLYEFESQEAGGLFRQGFKFTPWRLRQATSHAAIQRKAKELLEQAQAAAAKDKQKQAEAWKSAAMAWRQKNKPSREVLEAVRKAEAAKIARQIAAGRNRRPGYTPVGAFVDQAANRTMPGEPPLTRRGRPPLHARGGSQEPAAPEPPAEDAPEADWRAYHRRVNQAKVAAAATFEQVLRAFDVPCDLGRLKEAYRQATRMYHPDSNSADRRWRTPADKMECEEIMKIINEQRPDDL